MEERRTLLGSEKYKEVKRNYIYDTEERNTGKGSYGCAFNCTELDKGHLDNPRQSQNEERKRTFIFDIHMENELPDYLQYDFGLTN